MDKPEVVKRRPLTTKQRKYVKAKMQGKTGTQAAVEAYGVDEKTASVISSQNLSKLSIQEALEAEYEKQGISIGALVQPITDGLKAEKVVGEGNTVPDHSIRIAAAKLGGQWLGIGKQQEATPLSVHFHNHQAKENEQYGL